VWAYWILFLLAPDKAEPDVDGFYDLDEITEPRLTDQRLQRDMPYSICRGIRE
jgi:hypothetical protein